MNYSMLQATNFNNTRLLPKKMKRDNIELLHESDFVPPYFILKDK